MRIAMVSEHASPLAALGGVDAGGQNVYVAALALELARLGQEVTVYTRRDDPLLPDRVVMAPGVAVEHVPAGPPKPILKDLLLPHMNEFGAHLGRAWTTWRPDVVHAHFWMSGLAALEASECTAVPVVHTFHALGVVKRRNQGTKDTSPPRRIEEENEIIRRADWIVSTSTDELFELKRLGADVGRVSVVPCGVDLDLFHPDGPAERRARGRRRIVVVSRLVERKGIGNVIRAVGHLEATELIIVGGPPIGDLFDDPEAHRLAALAECTGVADRVEFRGQLERHEVPALLRSADVVACVPWYEPFGMVPLEAMACGTPVVATAVGGHVDTVVDGVTGVHVPPRDLDALIAGLRKVLGDEDLRKSLGINGARRARAHYGWRSVAHALLEIYAHLSESSAVRSSSGVPR
jgi:D-inositol-3-phosphate glycosyltransferase